MTKLTQLPPLAIPHRFICTVARKTASYENRNKREMIVVPEYTHTHTQTYVSLTCTVARIIYALGTREIYMTNVK